MTASPEHDLLREQREMPMRGNCVLFATMLAALMLLGSTATRASFASRQIAGDTPANARTKTATLVVFNDSGPSAIPFRLSVEENGRTIVRLSRHQYERVMIAPGRHVFNIPPRQKPRVALDAEAGHTYFLVAAHRPERSYAMPSITLCWNGSIAKDCTKVLRLIVRRCAVA